MDMDDYIVLKVSEAVGKDVGKGIARIDPERMHALQLEIGDILTISGTASSTVARVLPTYSDSRGKQLIQIDGILRKNANVSLDEKVRIQKAQCQNAKNVILIPSSNAKWKQDDADKNYISRLLAGIPVMKGNTIRLNLFGTQSVDFTVKDLYPSDPAIITSDTAIKIEYRQQESASSSGVSYEDIGGLGKQLQRIREMIELPLKYPEIFDRLGIEAPKGILLYGPPGTGKTLIVKAVANETAASFYHINGPEIINKYYGESEAKLREIFEKANKNAPSIIFLDEIDAIAPKREEVRGEVEKRVVAQLLGLMDGLKDRGQVIVIGATNIPNALDSALRRPGRFDRELEVGIPNTTGRLEILNIHTRGMPLSENVDLEKMAEITHGFVGADLQALCREAAMSALRNIFSEIDFKSDIIPYETLLQLYVTMGDFYNALKDIEPSAIREFFLEVPDVTWKDVGGLQEVKDAIKQMVIWPLKYGYLYDYAGCQHPKGILMFGTPGTGKTLVAKAVANECGINFISIKGPELMSKWVGESEKAVRELFKKAKQAAPCIIFIDEVDALVPVRGSHSANDVTERVLSQLLIEIDGVEELKNVYVIAATNRLDMIDPALLRPGRFDNLIEFKLPDKETRKEIFKIHMKRMPLAEDAFVDKLVDLTEGYSGAEIKDICNKAALYAIEEHLKENCRTPEVPNFTISMMHFENTLRRFRCG